MAGCVDKSFLPANYMKDTHCNNPCDPKWAKAKDWLPLEKKTSRPMKMTTILIKKNCIYLEAFRMSTKQPHFFFAITEWYSVNRTTIIFV